MAAAGRGRERGLTDTRFTEKVYTNVLPAKKREAMDRLSFGGRV
ncbi:MAG TPA: hypothetical protein VHI54_10145 [Actinomycetota bacterium]|nr:hypothetical protein [Actinomycetota bacterium]